jgi:UDP-N-acetylglucosamine 2-epimerase (non-hydrolysing)
VPVTIEIGANRLAGIEAPKIAHAAEEALSAPAGRWTLPPLWDGRAADRIADHMGGFLS